MPAVSVYIPTPFRKLTGNRQHVEAEGKDVGRGAGQRRQAVPRLSRAGLRQRQRRARAHQHLRQQAGDQRAPGHRDEAQRRRRGRRHPRHGRRLRRWAGAGAQAHRCAHGGAGEPILAPHHHAAGGAERAAQDHGVERADHRRRRARLADRRLSRARRHGQDRHRRLRHRRYQQLAAADPAPERRHRQAEGGLREGDDQRLQPGRRGGDARSADHVGQRDGDHRWLRLRDQRRRQLRRALPGQRHLPLPARSR